MKDLQRIIKDKKCLVFIDLEATQISHEMIQIGAYKTYLKPDGTIRKCFKPFELLVKPKHRVGPVVTELTGITDYRVKKDGVTYRAALQAFRKYCGRDFDHCLFVVYGNSDGNIFKASGENNMDASMAETMFIVHHLFDFCAFAARYIRGDDGNPMSLTRLLDVFGIPFDGQAHTALADAKNLMHLYQAFLTSPEILKREYKKHLTRFSGENFAIREVVRKLAAGEDITAAEFDSIIEQAIQ